MKFDNELNDAQVERLAILAEEMGEALQAVGKILRHGYESNNPLTEGPSNRESLTKEIGDVQHAVNMLIEAGDLSRTDVNFLCEKKAKSIVRWLHHQQPAPTAQS